MKLHVISLPHTQTTRAFDRCAFTAKARKLAEMMQRRGHDVVLYAGEENEVEGVELVTCITKDQQADNGFRTIDDAINQDYDFTKPLWRTFNRQLISALRERVGPREHICIPQGWTWADEIADAFPANKVVEHGVGYAGISQRTYRVFDSYAWRNFVYGRYSMDGQCYDEVIPNYWDVDEFPEPDPQDYYFWIGRLNARKGLHIAQSACEKMGARLVVAGQGEHHGYGEHIGTLDHVQRGYWMSRALAVFTPTIYVPPFEKVHVEAMMCGTPAITTDFGAFSETVQNGVNGYRCTMLADFIAAAEDTATWDLKRRRKLRKQTQAVYGLEPIGARYEAYFNRLSTLYRDGFDTL